MGRKYLEDIGWESMDVNPNDSRHKEWAKERETFGFDETETWNLCDRLYEMIYERLKMFNEYNCVNTGFHTFEYKDETLTMQQCIDRILVNLELAIKTLFRIKKR